MLSSYNVSGQLVLLLLKMIWLDFIYMESVAATVKAI